MGVKITNNASATLAASITNSATTLTVTSGQGASFPTLTGVDYCWLTLVDTSNNVEVIKCTARSTDSFTIVRAQDNTTARAFAINDRLELRPTAALFDEFANPLSEKGSDIASASPLVITAGSDYFDVTGTTNFSAMTVAVNRQFTLQFDGVLTMTHHATNLDLPGEANITTAAGDVATFQSTGANTVQCINYTRADGTAIVGASLDGAVVINESGADVDFRVESDDNANMLFVDGGNDRVGIGTNAPTSPLHVLATAAGQTVAKFESNQAGSMIVDIDPDTDRDGFLQFSEGGTKRWDFWMNGSSGTNQLKIRDEDGDTRLELTQDGRGLAAFTAKSWCMFAGTSTVTVHASHNVSSVTDQGTGQYRINFTNAMGSSNYSVNFTPYGGKLMGRAAQDAGYTEVRNYNPDNGNYEDNSEVNASVFAN
jgi:hypothetical protein